MKPSSTSIRFSRYYFGFVGCITATIGLGLLVYPEFLSHVFLDTNLSVPALFFIRFAGTSLIGFSVLNLYVAYSGNIKKIVLAAWVNIASLLPASFISIWTYPLMQIDKNNFLIVFEHIFFLIGFVAVLLLLKTRPLQKSRVR